MKDLSKYILQIADTSFILSHRLGEYSSNGPFLEEDLAITNTSLDHIGLAEVLYNHVAEIEGNKQTGDEIAFRRNENEYFNLCIVEQENTDFAFVVVRQYFIDLFNIYFFEELKNSKDELLSAMANKSFKEMKYHLRRSREWVLRLGQGTKESNAKMQNAINDLWKYTSTFFEMNAVDQEMLKQGIGVDLSKIETLWSKEINNHFAITNLTIPEGEVFVPKGKLGFHTEKLGHLLCDLQFLHNKYPNATW